MQLHIYGWGLVLNLQNLLLSVFVAMLMEGVDRCAGFRGERSFREDRFETGAWPGFSERNTFGSFQWSTLVAPWTEKEIASYVELMGTEKYSLRENAGLATLFFMLVPVQRVFFGGEWAKQFSVVCLDSRESTYISCEFSTDGDLSAASWIRVFLG